MPRPKRSKVASTATRVAQPPKPAEPRATRTQSRSRKPVDTNTASTFGGDDKDVVMTRTTRTRKPQTQEQQEANSTPAKNTSDDSDGLVTRNRRTRKSQTHKQEEADYAMSGALPAPSDEGTKTSAKIRTPLSRASRKTRTSEGSMRTGSARKSPNAVTSAPQMSARKIAEQAEPEEGDSSGFGDYSLSFTSLGSDSPAHGTRPPSAIKVGATPAHERSILALTNFKRRARQPSLLRMVHQTTDVEDNDIDTSLGDLDDSFDLEHFQPNAESTPLPKQLQNQEKVKGNDSGVNLSSSGSRGTKRKISPVIQVPRSSPPYDASPEPEVGESRSPSPSLPDVVRSTVEAAAVEEDEDSEIMAPPMSSSDYPIDEDNDSHISPVRSKRRRSRAASGENDDESSEGEKTERPTRAKAKQKPVKTKSISTAKLQAMLPKRRTQLAHENDDEDSVNSLDSDQDELALPPRRANRKAAPPRPVKKATRASKKAAAPAKGTKRTYGRLPSSDKENDGRAEAEDDSDASNATVQEKSDKPSAHLEAMAEKFKDIDAFDLDFESVSYVQTSSSPYR